MNLKYFVCLCIALCGIIFGVQAGDAVVNPSPSQLVEQFKSSKVFWQQFEIARKIVAAHDTNILPELASDLINEDRHISGNTAFIFAGLGDDRGFAVIRQILDERSERPKGQGVPAAPWTPQTQITSDRYYAVHLFGDLKDPRVVPILIPLLHDQEVNSVVPWALGEIGDQRAVVPLMDALKDQDPSQRVLAIYALEKLRARKALPNLQALLHDHERSHFGEGVSVVEAARAAIATLETEP